MCASAHRDQDVVDLRHLFVDRFDLHAELRPRLRELLIHVRESLIDGSGKRQAASGQLKMRRAGSITPRMEWRRLFGKIRKRGEACGEMLPAP